jgi:hypothetical protein
MYRILSVVVLPGLLLASVSAAAGDLNKRLKGDFAVTFTSFCAQTQAGFDNGIALSAATPLNRIVTDTHTFNGDGTLTRAGRSFQLTGVVTSPGGFPTSQADFSCSGTYQVDQDNSYTETTTCSGTVLTGTAAGQKFTQTPVTFHGRVRGKTLVLDSTPTGTPTVLTLSGFGDVFRLCGAGGTGIKIKKSE